MVEMRVKGLIVDAQTGQPVVFLSDLSETRFLPIWIGVYENDAILLVLEKIQVPRPITHDLLRAVIEELHARLERVVIHTLDDKTTTYYAKLVLIREGETTPVEVDARPSDSIALALRCKAPIFVNESVLAQPEVIKDKEKVNQEIEKFKSFLASVKPSDFEAYDRSHGTPPDKKKDNKDEPPDA